MELSAVRIEHDVVGVGLEHVGDEAARPVEHHLGGLRRGGPADLRGL